MWAEIVREYTEKGAYAQTDLHTKFLESKCPVRGDVRQFLDELRAKRDELSAVSIDIEEKDYRSTIIQSLPNHLAIFVSGQLTTARLYSPTKTINPDILISLIIEESERRTARDAHPPQDGVVDVSGDAVRPPTGKEGRALCAGIADRETTLRQPAPNQISQREIALTQQEDQLTQQQTMTMKTMTYSIL
ncbi:hypothetical protein BDR03DRAFT_1007316 [Suillus americanus]|nr:hypothetical protein BDR03DRAFT_1007316 [Suillus americanus]